MAHYNAVPSVCTLAPLDAEEASKGPNPAYLPPGTSVIKLTGDAAMIGEYQEIWWCGRGSVFAADTDGNVYPELRKVILRMDSPGAMVRKMQPPPNADGTEVPPVVTCDWSITRDALRLKGWYRVDPVLKALGVSSDGLLSRQQWETAREHVKVAMSLCNPKALAMVAELNAVRWRSEFQHSLTGRIGKTLQSYFAGLDTDNRRKERKELLELTDAKVKQWIQAFEDASKPGASEESAPKPAPKSKEK